MSFIVCAQRRGISHIEVPLAYLDDQAALFARVKPDIQGRDRNEQFIGFIKYYYDCATDHAEFCKAVTSIVYYLLFGHAAHNDTQRVLRESAAGIELYLGDDGMQTHVYDSRAEFDGRIEQIKSSETPVAPPPVPTVH